MNIDEQILHITSFIVTIYIGEDGHAMKVEISNRGDGTIYGASVIEHRLPRGGLCRNCYPHLISINTEFGSIFDGAVREHPTHCYKKTAQTHTLSCAVEARKPYEFFIINCPL